MVKYLQMDGVDDKLTIPTITFNKVVMDVSMDVDGKTDKRNILKHTGGNMEIHNGYQFRFSQYTPKFNGSTIAYGANIAAHDERRITVEANIPLTTASPEMFAYGASNLEALKGNIYRVRFYNDSIVIADYNMSTGTVLDQSGNGNHAILAGGTWMEAPTYHLSMDGVDDVLRTAPSVTLNKIVLVASFDGTQPNGTSYVFDARTDVQTTNPYGYIQSGATQAPKAVSVTSQKVDGVESTVIVPGKKHTMEFSFNAITADANGIEFFTNYIAQSIRFTKGKIYSIHLYNGTSLIAHYDMTTGSVADRTDNFKHATLTGGTWVTESSITGEPKVSIVNVERTIISGKAGVDRTVVTFKFDVDVTEWEVRVFGSGAGTGTLADSGGAVAASTSIAAEIDWTELYQEGQNRVNIYGKSTGGNWTLYEE